MCALFLIQQQSESRFVLSQRAGLRIRARANQEKNVQTTSYTNLCERDAVSMDDQRMSKSHRMKKKLTKQAIEISWKLSSLKGYCLARLPVYIGFSIVPTGTGNMAETVIAYQPIN